MLLHLHQSRRTHLPPTPNVLRIAAMFGLGVDQQRQLDIVPPTTVDLRGGQIVFITGPSGGGKTTLLRLIAEQLAQRDDVRLLDFATIDMHGDGALVDSFSPLSLERTCAVLSLAGLNDSFVMLRKPGELSDGQRYRFYLAQAIATVEAACDDGRLHVILADEFGATLDRTTAAIIARNIRKWVSRPRSKHVCFVAATTHDDLLEPFEPDMLIEKPLGEVVHVYARDGRS